MAQPACHAAWHLQKFHPDASRAQAAIVGGTGKRKRRGGVFGGECIHLAHHDRVASRQLDSASWIEDGAGPPALRM